MAEFKTRIGQKHDTEENWSKATNFVPIAGEIIVYDPDSTHATARTKIGNGETNINNLPFVSDIGYYIKATVDRQAFTEANWNTYGTIGHTENWSNTSNTGFRNNDLFLIAGTSTDAGKGHMLIYKYINRNSTATTLYGECIGHHIISARGIQGPKGDTGAVSEVTITGEGNAITSVSGTSNLTFSKDITFLTTNDIDQSITEESSNPISNGAVATALANKQSIITGAATTITSDNLTANRVLVSDAAGKVTASSGITATELNCLDNINFNIKTQFNTMQFTINVASYEFTHTLPCIMTWRQAINCIQDIDYTYSISQEGYVIITETEDILCYGDIVSYTYAQGNEVLADDFIIPFHTYEI